MGVARGPRALAAALGRPLCGMPHPRPFGAPLLSRHPAAMVGHSWLSSFPRRWCLSSAPHHVVGLCVCEVGPKGHACSPAIRCAAHRHAGVSRRLLVACRLRAPPRRCVPARGLDSRRPPQFHSPPPLSDFSQPLVPFRGALRWASRPARPIGGPRAPLLRRTAPPPLQRPPTFRHPAAMGHSLLLPPPQRCLP